MRTVRIDAVNESLHVFPLSARRKRLVAEQTRSFDTGGESLRTRRLLTGVAEETSWRAGKTGHRYPGPDGHSSQHKKASTCSSRISQMPHLCSLSQDKNA